MDVINRSATGLIGLFERYGMALVMLFVLDIFMPNLAPKGELLERDLSAVMASNSGTNVLKQLFWIGMFSGYLMLHLLDRLRVLRQSFWGWMLLAWLAVFVAAFTSDYVAISLKRALFQCIFLFMVFSATHYAYRNRSLRMCVWFAGLVIIALSLFTLVLGVGFSSLGLAGHTESKNVLGAYLTALIIMTVVVEFIEGRKVPFSFLFKLMLCGLLVLTQSKTSVAVLLLVLIMARSDLLLTLLSNLIMFSGFCLLFVFWPAISYELGGYWHLSQHISHEFMTNRGIIWDACYYDLERFGKLLTGWGYASYFGVPELPPAFDVKWSFLQYINSSHNGYISVLIQFGLFLSIPIYLALTGMIFHVRNLKLQAALMFPLIHNLTESSFLRDQHVVWFFFVWTCGIGLMVNNRTRQISIMEGLREYRLSQQVRWRARKTQQKPLDLPDVPILEPVVPKPQPPEVEPVDYPDNVIVATHWDQFKQTPEVPDLKPSDSTHTNVITFPARENAVEPASSHPTREEAHHDTHTVHACWSGVDLTLTTEQVAEPISEEALSILKNTATDNRVANGLVSCCWKGNQLLLVTDGITEPLETHRPKD